MLACIMIAACLFATGCEEQKEATQQTETKTTAEPKAVEKPVEAPKQIAAPKVAPAPAIAGTTLVKMQTSMGDIIIELDAKKAPATAKNFIDYVNENHYSGIIFHRVISGFMIQGGNFDMNMKKATTKAPIVNEAANGLQNLRGTIAMARTSNPNSATDQFFINHKDNPFLNAAPGKPGYAVFGKVVEGMEIVDAIAAVPTGTKAGMRDVPQTPVIIISAKVITN